MWRDWATQVHLILALSLLNFCVTAFFFSFSNLIQFYKSNSSQLNCELKVQSTVCFLAKTNRAFSIQSPQE